MTPHTADRRQHQNVDDEYYALKGRYQHLLNIAKEMAEATGFDEGYKGEKWRTEFERRKIEVVAPLLEKEANEPFELYKKHRVKCINPDIHPLQIAPDGSARQDDHHGGWFEFKTTFFTRAFFAGRWIPCISLDAQKLFHSGYEPRGKDLFDMQILDALIDAAGK